MVLLQKKWGMYYIPGQHLCVDESIIPYKGRTKIKTYNPVKPHKWGMKSYMLADSISYYCIKSIIYPGKEHKNTPKSNLSSENYSAKIMKELLFDYKEYNHKVFCDNYYTSPLLAEEFLKNKIFLTGVCRKNRKGLPNNIYAMLSDVEKNKKINKKLDEKNKIIRYIGLIKDKLNITIFADKKVIILLTTAYSNGSYDNKKPIVIEKYNKYAKGVDIHNSYTFTYRFPHKSVKFWKSIFFSLFENTVVNSFIIFKICSNKGSVDHLEFRKQLSYDLLQKYSYKNHIIRYNLKFQHFPGKVSDNKPKRCKVCGDRTKFTCKTCFIKTNEVFGLCILECFEYYHK